MHKMLFQLGESEYRQSYSKLSIQSHLSQHLKSGCSSLLHPTKQGWYFRYPCCRDYNIRWLAFATQKVSVASLIIRDKPNHYRKTPEDSDSCALSYFPRPVFQIRLPRSVPCTDSQWSSHIKFSSSTGQQFLLRIYSGTHTLKTTGLSLRLDLINLPLCWVAFGFSHSSTSMSCLVSLRLCGGFRAFLFGMPRSKSPEEKGNKYFFIQNIPEFASATPFSLPTPLPFLWSLITDVSSAVWLKGIWKRFK